MLPKTDQNKFLVSIIKDYTKNRLEEFRQYMLEIESKFDTDKSFLSKYYDEAINGLSEEEIREVNDYLSDDYYIIEEVNVSLHRKSILVSIYSFLENSMNSLCRHSHAIHKYPVKVDDLKGEGIVRAKNYIEKLASVDFSTLNQEWSHLMALNKIRNCIVHSEGDVTNPKSSSQLANIINNNNGLSLKDNRYIKIEKEFIDSCIDIIENFIENLYQQVFK